jgi:hypothetical protein
VSAAWREEGKVEGMSENLKQPREFTGSCRSRVCVALSTKHHVDHLLTLVLLFAIEQVSMPEMGHWLLGGGALVRSILMILFFGEEVG